MAVDGGMSDNIRPMLYGSRYAFALAGRAGDERSVPFTVVGKDCESGDVLGQDVMLPADVEPGDLLAVAATGAYAYAMVSVYNRVGRPVVVAVGRGTSRVILRREDAADLDRLEAVPGALPAVAAPDGVLIRPAHPADAPAYLELWTGVVDERRFVRTERVRETLREQRRHFRSTWHPDGAHLVALAGPRIMGTLSAAREAHPVNRQVASLGIAVAADHRGRGIGAALMAEAFRWAREFGVEKLALSVYPENRAAMALYAKFGFVEEGRLARHSKKAHGYEDEILMGRWVRE